MRIGLLFAAIALLCSFSRAKDINPDDTPHIDLVFCVDCSGSMGPVIETTKQKVWTIVNEVARAKPSPVLRIGLLGYGDSDQTYRQFDLTDDLDTVYKNLMTLHDEGWGNEFVGRAVNKATEQMTWSQGKQVLRIVYVLGNETARQGPAEFDYAKTAPAAIAKGIQVNAIYCGDTEQETIPTWQEMAKLADGQFLRIAGNGGSVIVATPFDDQLVALNTKLNTTYVPYGTQGGDGAANQAEQDKNSSLLGAATAAERAAAKGSQQYRNSRWDLVDAAKDKTVDLEELEEKQLPKEMQSMTAEQRREYLAKKAEERTAIHEQIKELSAKREQHIADEVKRSNLDDSKALDKAIRDTVVEQAKKKATNFSGIA